MIVTLTSVLLIPNVLVADEALWVELPANEAITVYEPAVTFTVAPGTPFTMKVNPSYSLLFNLAVNVMFSPITKSASSIVTIVLILSITVITVLWGLAAVK